MRANPVAKAAFLDKDGTLIENIPYNVDVSRIHLLDGVAEGLKLLSQAGFLLIVISNQAGVAKGYFPEQALEPVKRQLQRLFKGAGVELSDFYYCPHHPDGTLPEYRQACDCRKPEPGLLLRAAREWKIDLEASWMIGDSESDIEAGRRAGCRTARIAVVDADDRAADHRTPDNGATIERSNFLDAARGIVARGC